MKKITIVELFKMYLQGKVNASLSEMIRGWLSGQLNREDMDRKLEEYFDDVVTYREPTRGTYLRYKKLQEKLGFSKEEKVIIPFGKRLWVRVAAVLLPTVLAGSLIFMQFQEPVFPENDLIAGMSIDVVNGQAKHLLLPDSSIVMVNGNSRIIYAPDFSHHREVYVKGEAFFKVRKNQELPFIVKTRFLSVEVTGTEFNVQDVPDSGRTVISLVSGSVEVTAGREKINLTPMQQLEFDHIHKKTTLTATNEGWWTEPIVFRDQRLEEILQEVASYYNVTVKDRETLSDTRRYNIKFGKDDSLQQVLNILKRYSGQFDYFQTGDTVTIKSW